MGRREGRNEKNCVGWKGASQDCYARWGSYVSLSLVRTSPATVARYRGLTRCRRIVLPILRSLSKVYGPVSVIHFDAHIDTWNGDTYAGAVSEQSKITHGSFFWKAAQEGVLANTSSIHAGIRTRLSVRPFPLPQRIFARTDSSAVPTGLSLTDSLVAGHRRLVPRRNRRLPTPHDRRY